MGLMRPETILFTGERVFRICFVCTGNICRSPMAEAIFTRLVAEAGLGDLIQVTSAGTGEWHVGEQADQRTIAALTRRGLDIGDHRARRFEGDWFGRLDLIVAFDRGQERILRHWPGAQTDRSTVATLLSFASVRRERPDVPDPYYGGDEMFDEVLGMIEEACTQLFRQIEPAIRLGASR